MGSIGILGGSFDPPHNAHVAMAKTALEQIPLDRVLLMPAPSPPHKSGTDLSEYALRKAMVERAIAGEPRIELSLLEEFRSGPSYTHELLEHLKRQSNDSLFLILGADSVADLPKWKDPRSILDLATLVVFPRTGFPSAVPVDGDLAVILFEAPVIDVSSTEIRGRYRRGEPADEWLPAAVHEFILDNSLYS